MKGCPNKKNFMNNFIKITLLTGILLPLDCNHSMFVSVGMEENVNETVYLLRNVRNRRSQFMSIISVNNA